MTHVFYTNKYSYSQLLANLIITPLIHFPLFLAIFLVESPHAIGIISIFAPIILLDVAGHGEFFYIFIILYNIIIGFPFWNTIGGIIAWVPNITISFETATSLYMNLIVTLVMNHI